MKRLRLSTDDRITINRLVVRPLSDNEEGWVVKREDGLVESFSHEQLFELWQSNSLTFEPGYYSEAKARIRLHTDEDLLSNLSPEEREVCLWRQAFCDLFLQRRAKDPKKYKRTNESAGAAAKEFAPLIEGMGIKRPDKPEDKAKKVRKPRAKPKQTEQPADKIGVPSGRTLLGWVRTYEEGGCYAIALRDNRRFSGNSTARFPGEVLNLIAQEVKRFASAERPSKTDVHVNIERAVGKENKERKAAGLSALPVPGRDTIDEAVDRLPRYATMVARHGRDYADKHMPWVGAGLQIDIPGLRIEIDEHEIDLMTLCVLAGIWDQLTDDERALIERKRRLVIIAICVATKVILALRIIDRATPAAQLKALQMITQDKTRFARDASAKSSWHQATGLSAIVTDWNFLSTEVRTAVADAGATFEFPGAGDAPARGTIEHVFYTASIGPIARLTGRTWSNPVVKADYPSEERAGVTDDELADVLVNWAVDNYHNTPHDSLHGATPANTWDRAVRRYGIKPPPDQRTQRAIFGIKLKRTITSRGVRVMSNYYRTEDGPLAQHFRDRDDLEVEVRLNTDNLGAISVKLPTGQLIEVPCRDADMEGVTAQWWIEATTHLRTKFKHESMLSREVALESLDYVDEIAGRAYSRANAAAYLYSPEEIDQAEVAYFYNLEYADRRRPSLDDGYGEVISPAKTVPRPEPVPEPKSSTPPPRKDWSMGD